MSEVQHTPQPLAEATPGLQSESATQDSTAPVEQSQPQPVLDGNTTSAPLEENKLDSSVAAPAAEKIIEPIAEGQLGYKGPGLIK